MNESQLIKTTVILPVRELLDAVAWYQRVLGFKPTYIHGDGRRTENPNFANYAIMKRDQVEVHFIMDESTPALPAQGWQKPGNGRLGLTVSGIDALHASILATGTSVDGPVRPMNWPARGFNLQDPDGNAIHIEEPT